MHVATELGNGFEVHTFIWVSREREASVPFRVGVCLRAADLDNPIFFDPRTRQEIDPSAEFEADEVELLVNEAKRHVDAVFGMMHFKDLVIGRGPYSMGVAYE